MVQNYTFLLIFKNYFDIFLLFFYCIDCQRSGGETERMRSRSGVSPPERTGASILGILPI